MELPRWKKFIEVADMPKSDLLHHFESCCHFIREGKEKELSWCTGEHKLVQHQKSGVSSWWFLPLHWLTSPLSLLCPCSEHGISRSVTVVLAYPVV